MEGGGYLFFSLFCIVVLIKVDAKGVIKLVQPSVLQVLDMQEYNYINRIQHIYSNYGVHLNVVLKATYEQMSKAKILKLWI